MTGSPSARSGATPGVSLQTVIDAPRRLDELSTARVIGEAADAVHKAQQGGQPLGTLMPQAILVATTGISLAPPATPSIAYTAPERLRGGSGDRRSDVFSLGVVLWEALAHERLFDAATDDARKKAVLEREIQPPSELNANVPAELDAICKKALDRDPANRYQSAKVMAAEISAVLDDAGYPDTHDEIASYLASTFPGAAAGAAPGAALAAKLAAAPSAAPAAQRQQLNMTMHGMAPIREPVAKPEPANPEPAKPEAAKPEAAKPDATKPAAKPEPAKPEAAKLQPMKPEPVRLEPAPPILPAPRFDPSRTIPVGSGLSLADLPKAPVAEPQSGLSPIAFSKPSMLADAPATKPAPDPTMGSTQPGTGIPTLAPAEDLTVTKPQALIFDEPKSKALVVDEPKPKTSSLPAPKPTTSSVTAPKPKASISNAETVATPALAAVPRSTAPPAPSSGITGLPAMPPGATHSLDADFSANAGSKLHAEVPVQQAPTASAPAVPSTDPAAAVSLPRRSRTGNERNSTPDVLADWGWSTDSHAAVYDGDQDQYEEAPNTGRKRLLLAIGGALGAILLIVVIAVVASGGGDDKAKEKAEEAPIADTSRTAEPANAKMADPAPAPAPADPAPTPPPADVTVTQPPPTDPVPAEPAPVEPAAVDTAKVEAAKIEAAKAEAAEAAKVDAANQKLAKAEAAKAEAARIETAQAEKAEAARLAKIEASNTAAAKAADAARIKADKAEAARIARAEKLEAAKKRPVETAKPPREPKKKEPKIAKVSGTPIDPYAADKAPKADPSIAYKTGFQQYVRGDTSGALSTFKTSLLASPSYPPTWRGLGLVYEKMGQKAQAKKSFQRYLQLSPKASDAQQIRGRLERLK